MRLNSGYRWAVVLCAAWMGSMTLGCGESSNLGGAGVILVVDAEYDPAAAADVRTGVNETTQAVGQTFTVLGTGTLARIQIAVTQAAGGDGTIRIDIRPVSGGVPEDTDANSLITPIDVDTTTLPAQGTEIFSVFSNLVATGSLDVTPGQTYAIVVTFISRATGAINSDIAEVVGRMGNEYADGTGATRGGGSFAANTNDYFFRTFIEQ